MSDYSGWMPSQIKIELRRRRVRATGRKADLVQSKSRLVKSSVTDRALAMHWVHTIPRDKRMDIIENTKLQITIHLWNTYNVNKDTTNAYNNTCN